MSEDDGSVFVTTAVAHTLPRSVAIVRERCPGKAVELDLSVRLLEHFLASLV